MGKKIDWFNGKNALNDYDMQEICDQLANVDTPQNLAEVIKGSESVVVDVSEDNKSLEIHLDAETTADISRSLKTPVSAPAETKLVAVDTTNSQEMLALGAGLSIENGALNAEKMYKHIVNFNRMPESGSPFGSESFQISFYSSNPKPVETIKEFINLYCNKPIDYEYQTGDTWVQASIPMATNGFTAGALGDGRRYIKLAPQVSLLLYSTTRLSVIVSRLIDDFTFERETWEVRDEDISIDTVN